MYMEKSTVSNIQGGEYTAAVTMSKRTSSKHIRQDVDAEPHARLTVATCQFSISGDIEDNCAKVIHQMRIARKCEADVAHFSEAALGGYAGADFSSFDGYDWNSLRCCTERIMKEAGDLKLWVILGSNHQLAGKRKPHNSLYVISDHGDIVDRYDKMFCTGNKKETSGDLKHYSAGSHFVVVTIKGIKCGFQICHDMRYPELYREYYKLGVQLMFHSYRNSRRELKNPNDPDQNIWGVITEPTMQTYAAENNMWISANNTATRESCWPSFFVRPDGVITGRLKRNQDGLLITTVDTKYSFYDASAVWRFRARCGIYHSGTLVYDRRSEDRTSL